MQERYETFTSLVMNINRYILKIKNSEMHEFGLKGNQVQCLHYLFNEANGLTSKQLAELCEEDKAAISRTLKSLENNGLIFVEENSAKKYRNPYRLTDKGLEYGKAISSKIDGIMEVASKGIDDVLREKLYLSLRTICTNLKNISENKE